MKEKFIDFSKKHYLEISFVILSIFLFGFFALPFFNFNLKADDIETNIASITFYELMMGTTINLVPFNANPLFIAIFTLSIISIVLVLVYSLFPTKINSYIRASGLVLLILIIFLLCFSINLYETMDATYELLGANKVRLHMAGFVCTLLTVIFMTVILLGHVSKDLNFEAKEMVEISMLVAVALVLDKITLYKAPSGGSINLAGIALLILAVRWGPIKGFIGSSIIFGLISCLFDGWGFQTYPLDYLVAFSGYAFAGLFYNIFKKTTLTKQNDDKHGLIYLNLSLILGAICVMITRMIGSGTSSMVLYGLEFGESMIYNISYVGPSAAISVVACMLLSPAIYAINKRYPTTR